MEFEFCIGAHARAAPNALHYRAEVFSVGKSEQNIKICLISCDICLMLLNAYFDTETTACITGFAHTRAIDSRYYP